MAPTLRLCAALMAVMFASVSAQNTITFATSSFHEFPPLDTVQQVGIGLGWGLFAIFVLTSAGLILMETFQRDKEISGQVETARNKMYELKIDVAKVDAEYLRKLKGHKHVEGVEDEVEDARA